jgi:hypothetical protein
MNWKTWLNGVIGGFVGASANSITLMISDPEHFNVTTTDGWKHLGLSIIISGGVGSALYLKTHPTPWTGEERRGASGAAVTPKP